MHGTELLHVLLEKFFRDIPSHVSHEQCSVLLAVGSIVWALRFLFNFLLFELRLCGFSPLFLLLLFGLLLIELLLWYLQRFCFLLLLFLFGCFCLVHLLLLVDGLDAFGFDDFLLALVCVVDHVLNFGLVAILR